jgi:hypothetical protein
MKITSLGGGIGMNTVGVGVPEKLTTVTGASKSKTIELDVAPGTDQEPVRVMRPARDGAANAKLATRPVATAKNELFIIENSLVKT